MQQNRSIAVAPTGIKCSHDLLHNVDTAKPSTLGIKGGKWDGKSRERRREARRALRDLVLDIVHCSKGSGCGGRDLQIFDCQTATGVEDAQCERRRLAKVASGDNGTMTRGSGTRGGERYKAHRG